MRPNIVSFAVTCTSPRKVAVSRLVFCSAENSKLFATPARFGSGYKATRDLPIGLKAAAGMVLLGNAVRAKLFPEATVVLGSYTGVVNTPFLLAKVGTVEILI